MLQFSEHAFWYSIWLRAVSQGVPEVTLRSFRKAKLLAGGDGGPEEDDDDATVP